MKSGEKRINDKLLLAPGNLSPGPWMIIKTYYCVQGPGVKQLLVGLAPMHGNQ